MLRRRNDDGFLSHNLHCGLPNDRRGDHVVLLGRLVSRLLLGPIPRTHVGRAGNLYRRISHNHVLCHVGAIVHRRLRAYVCFDNGVCRSRLLIVLNQHGWLRTFVQHLRRTNGYATARMHHCVLLAV